MLVHNKNKGFSLTELMVVIGILAIIAAIGYPSYQEQLREGRRQEAIQGLYNRKIFVETAINNDTYATDKKPPATTSIPAEILSYYTISYVKNGDNYTLTATANPGPQTDDTGCTILVLTSLSDTPTPSDCL